METKKTDLEQLKGILEQFSEDTINEAVREIQEEAPIQKIIKDFPDPGKEVNVGDFSRVELEEMSPIERIIDPKNNLLPVHFLEEGGDVQKAVARVRIPGKWFGTGFLVSRSLFLTNNHVIPNEHNARTAEFQFNYQLDYHGNPQSINTYTADPDDVFHTNASLDYTLVRLDPRCRWVPSPGPGPGPRPHPKALPTEPETEAEWGEPELSEAELSEAVLHAVMHPKIRVPPWKKVCTYPGQVWGYLQMRNRHFAIDQHVNIIQHPRARRKEVALQKNLITTIYPHRIRYLTDTEGGSSGSPVFDNEWELLAIHHAAGEWDDDTHRWLNNEGMRIDSIIEDLRGHYSGSTAGRRILAELGI